MSFVDVQILGCGDAFGSGGRFNTCFHVTAPKVSFLIDCGASSMVAMKKFNVDPNSIDIIFLSHLHGDHFAGVIFFLMDASYIAGRQKPLVIAGPKGVKKRILDTMELLYPNCWEKHDFQVVFVELRKDHHQTLMGVGVFPYQASHLGDGNDFILRFDVEGKVITFSGDTGWTDELIPATKGADLLLCESSHFAGDCEIHLSYETIHKKRYKLDAKHIVLTHLGPAALAQLNDIKMQVAFDGMKISV